MPEPGEVRHDPALSKDNRRYVWRVCPDCGKSKWVMDWKVSQRCGSCAQAIRRRQRHPTPQGTIEHPVLGDIRSSFELRRKTHITMIYHACELCGKPRWVHFRNPISKLCYQCSHVGEHAAHWKGGRGVAAGGYIACFVPSNSPFHAMANSSNRAYEHRIVMAKHLSRCLYDWEVVHHKNGNRQDNRIENLELLVIANHPAGSTPDKELHALRLENEALKAEHALLTSLLIRGN